MPYTIVLDGYTFPQGDLPFRGPLEEITPQKWIKQNPLGDADPGSILTLINTESPEWEFVSRASAATVTKLKAVFAAQATVTLKTPQNPTTGFTVQMTRLKIRHQDPLENSKSLCTFVLVKR